MRGSTPCASPANHRYGGNTACVGVDVPGRPPIMFDLGTGARFYGMTQPQDGTYNGVALVTHLHWDHVQGLPFFTPILRPGAHLDVYGPKQEGLSLEEAVRQFMCPPYFPVEIDALPGTFRWIEAPEEFEIADVAITSRDVPHVGATLGYRLVHDGRSVAYLSDHQQPGCGTTEVAEGAASLAEGVDVLIHDAQYTVTEFYDKADWGHCTVEYAVEVAAQAGARRLVLFHHDPAHDDDMVDSLLRHATALATRRGVAEVVAAYEGLSIQLGG